jgi:hypothetical protein
MKNIALVVLMSFVLWSCNEDDFSEVELVPEVPDELTIFDPVIIGEENIGCVANIIFLAEGFTDSEMNEFVNLCNIAKQAILDMEPFASSESSLNFYRVESPSITSGIKTIQYTSECNGTTGINTTSNTPWSVYGNRVGLPHFAGVDFQERNKIEELYGVYATGDYAYTIIIANTTDYVAGAEFPGFPVDRTIVQTKVSNMIVSKHDGGDIFKYLVRHEFGHSFGNLEDEYVDENSACLLKELDDGSFSETPRGNVLTYNPGSWFEGAKYLPTGYWREWEDSIMRSDYYATTFSPIQREIVTQRLMEAIGCNQ